MIRYAILISALIALPCSAEVRLPKLLSSNMVLQQNRQVTIWGWADAGESVSVTCSWLDKRFTTKANDEGHWSVEVNTQKAGGPHKLSVAASNQMTLDNILFGEVWLASGQSNMEMPLVKVSGAYTAVNDSQKEVASANYPKIRLFQAGNFSSKDPIDDVQPGIQMYGIPPAECKWNECAPSSVPNFSSTAYFFARELHKQLQVPIGIIDSSWGGTSAEAWTPFNGLKKLGYASDLEKATTLPQQPDQKIPTRLYNGMIHPLRKFEIKGSIWYQGEGNSGRAEKYRDLFSTMIREWRSVFDNEFPFYFAQISPFNYSLNSAYLREAQFETLSVPKTGMAVTMDIGNLTDIHPKNKQEVGRRLALWALAKDYGQDLVYSGPLYQGVVFEDKRARISFQYVGSGLTTNDGKAPSHFELAGEDKQFHAALAEIDGDQVIVSCDQVDNPKSVRFAFSSQAMPNLTNSEGLPASSFRSDRW